MKNPISNSNMEQKYINHLNVLETHISKELKNLPGAQLINCTNNAPCELFLHINYTMKLKTGELPIRVKVSHKFPNEAPKAYVLSPVRHSVIDGDTLEINYKTYYNFSQNGKISDLINATIAHFNNNPFVNNEVDKKIDALMNGMNSKNFLDLKESSLKEFYEQLT